MTMSKGTLLGHYFTMNYFLIATSFELSCTLVCLCMCRFVLMDQNEQLLVPKTWTNHLQSLQLLEAHNNCSVLFSSMFILVMFLLYWLNSIPKLLTKLLNTLIICFICFFFRLVFLYKKKSKLSNQSMLFGDH